ncbi:hypothetical protein EC912_10526 [Luteibacter rhizovicinus]|uniref:Uncharacterized protein n=2 Tax=Luteibacter rhizovicinus TaxID=242606 RepID=A0A4R3YLK9_9GAMM|nr:hypothetical protein EC912_10526 [Luteibacter rhizovicinus]
MAPGFIPIVGSIEGIVDAAHEPTPFNITMAVIGALPEGGSAAAKVIKGVENSAKEVSATSKTFSSEKKALVDMAKADKRTGITSADMQAYKDLNRDLPDPFPSNKVRGPEAHSSGAPTSQQPHGHVGPVDHIPIQDP